MNIKDLAKAYPKAIDPKNPVPLAIGALRQIDIGFSLTKSRKVLRKYCLKTKYLEALSRPGAIRCNLDGAISGPVSDEHAMKALAIVERRRKRDSRIESKRPILTLKGATQ